MSHESEKQIIYEGRKLSHWFYIRDTELDETHRKASITLVSRGSDAILVADHKTIHIAIVRWLRDVINLFSGTDKIRETRLINAPMTLLTHSQITIIRHQWHKFETVLDHCKQYCSIYL